MRATVAAMVVGMLTAFLLWPGATAPDPSPPPLPTETFSVGVEQVGQVPLTEIDRNHQPGLSVPRVGIRAEIAAEPLRFNDGVLDAPDDARMVGYAADAASLSSQVGTTLLAGHVQTRSVARGALWDLARTKPGDLVITSDQYSHTMWQVIELSVRKKREGVPHALFDTTGDRRLVIVTCGGEGHSYNIIVVAAPIR